MLWTSALAIYVLFWFLCLFFVLPFYGRRDGGEGAESTVEGADPGAPAQFPVVRVIGRVTMLSALFFAIYYACYTSGYFTREMLSILPPAPAR